MSENSESNPECPLCLEPLEMDDINFFPCVCGYQICRFCWHRIRTNENGLCPACRKQYSEDPANFKPLTPEELQQIKNEKRQKDLQRKQKLSENRKHLANVRVVQRNLVFVVGLPPRLADPEELRKSTCFGKFGKILKVIVNHSTSYAGSQGPSASAYVTYQKSEDALRAIQAVNNSKVDGKTLKASLGTTKYCSHFLKKMPCPKQDCMYLHELGDDAASFTKEEMQAGKHQEYEHKLYEQMIANSSQNRKQLSPVDHTDTSQFLQKEQWPSPPKKEESRQNIRSENTNYMQLVSNSQKTTYESTSAFQSKEEHLRCQREQNHDFPRHFTSQPNNLSESYFETKRQGLTNCLNGDPSIRHTAVREVPVNCAPSDHRQNSNYASNQPTTQTSQSFESHSLSRNHEAISQKPQQNMPSEQTLGFGSQLLEHNQPKLHSMHPPGLPNGFSQYKNIGQIPTELLDPYTREHIKYTLQNGNPNSSSQRSGFTKEQSESNSRKPFESENCSSVLMGEFKFSRYYVHDSQNDRHSITNNSMENHIQNSFTRGENHFDGQDDDLGFDPWHESSKGLADLMVKEEGERIKTTCFPHNRLPLSVGRRTVISSEPVMTNNRGVENPHFSMRQTVPPPGFSANTYGANSPLLRPYLNNDAFSNKLFPVMSSYNHSTSAPISQFQGVNPQLNMCNNMMAEARIRPQIHDWSENLTNGVHSNADLNFISSNVPHIPAHMNRLQSKTASSYQISKMLQQLKLADPVRYHNFIKHNSFAFRGSSLLPYIG